MKLTPFVVLLAVGTNAFYISPRSSEATQEISDENCATNLSGPFEFPHLIIPINSSAPDTASGTSYFGEVSSNISSIFNFDIPDNQALQRCSLVFLFPSKEQRHPDSYILEGDGAVRVSQLVGPVTTSTNFNNAPKVASELQTLVLKPDSSYRISTFDCPVGQQIAFKISNAGTTNLRYFQDYGNPPFGLFITRCPK